MTSTEFKLKILTLNTSELLAASFNTLSSNSPELVVKLNDKEYPIIDINNNIIVTINIYIFIFFIKLYRFWYIYKIFIKVT